MTDRELLAIFEKYAPQHGNPEDINNAIEALRARLAQPEREWVDLTNDEIDDIWAEFNDGYGIIEETLWGYERAIEAKLREKNG